MLYCPDSFFKTLLRNNWKICISDQISRSVVSDSLRPHELQHAGPPCPSPTPGVHSNSGSSSQWCHPAISSSVVPLSSCPQSLPASESFPICLSINMVIWYTLWNGTNIKIIGTYIASHSLLFFLFLMVRMLEVFSWQLSSTQYHIIKRGHNTIHYTLEIIVCVTENVYPLTYIASFLPSSALGNHHSIVCFYEVGLP